MPPASFDANVPNDSEDDLLAYVNRHFPHDRDVPYVPCPPCQKAGRLCLPSWKTSCDQCSESKVSCGGKCRRIFCMTFR